MLCSKQECACAAPGIDRPLYHRAGVPLLYCSSMVAEQKLEELEGKLAMYEEQQKVAAASMKAEVQQQVAVVEEGLRELYSKADVALINLSRRLDEVENMRAETPSARRRGRW